MLEAYMIYYRITGYDNLKFFSKIYNIPNYKQNIADLAKKFELEKWLPKFIEKYSTGMKCKLAFCRALLIDAPILFLDEPTFGMDVSSTLQVVDEIKNLEATVFLTSHNMDIVGKLCDYKY